MSMRSNQLILKCYAKQEEGSWVAVCLDFSLAVQSNSLSDAKKKLEDQIHFYVSEALEDNVYGLQLLNRRAPIYSWLEYYYIKLLSILTHKPNRVFNEKMPMRPA